MTAFLKERQGKTHLVIGPIRGGRGKFPEPIRTTFFSDLIKNWPYPHETQEKSIKKNLFSAGQYRSTEKGYDNFLLSTSI